MSEQISGRDFGRIEAEVIALKAQNARLEQQIGRLDEKLELLVAAVTEAKGGWRMLMAVGGASAAAGAAVIQFIAWVKGGHI